MTVCFGLSYMFVRHADVDEDAATDIHRGLRQPALLMALTEVVRDNDTGADAQRAAASALLTFCEVRSPESLHLGVPRPCSGDL